jgi:hypothetical protein
MKSSNILLNFSIIFLMLAGSQTKAQYTFSPSTLLQINQAYNTLTYDSINIANLSADTLHLRWTLISYDSLSGTYLDFCASGECFLGFPLLGNFPPIIPNGFGYAGAHFWTGSVPATSTAKIWVYPQGDPAHGDTLTFILHAQHGSGIDDISHTDDAMKIYPNPSPGLFYLSFIATIQNTKADVINSCGQIVLSKEINNTPSTTFDLTNHPKGVYFIKVHSWNGEAIRKVIID